MSRHAYHFAANVKFIFTHILRFSPRILLLHAWTVPSGILVSAGSSFFAGALVETIRNGDLTAMVCVTAGFMLLRLALNVGDRYIQNRLKSLNHHFKAYFIEQYAMKCMHLDYELSESPEIRDRAQRTHNQLFSSARKVSSTQSMSTPLSVDAYPALFAAILSRLLGITLYTGIISILNPWLALILLFISCVSWFTQKRLAESSHASKKDAIPVERRINYIGREARDFAAVKDIRLYGISQWFHDIFEEQFSVWKRIMSRQSRLKTGYTALLEGINALFRLAVYLYLFASFYQGIISVSEFVLYLGIITGFGTWILELVGSIEQVIQVTLDVDDIRSFLELPVNSGGSIEPDPADCSIRFSDVSYAYPGDREHPAVDHISFEIHHGEKIGIVGTNGSGKTTLIKLLCGLYAPQSGTITIGGTPLPELSQSALRSMIAPVFQDIYLLPTSIARNIALDREIDHEKLSECIRQAGLSEKIASLPRGTETTLLKSVLDDAVDLSGGEVQKLALARALYKGGSILILDEPTAALDPVAENRMYLRYHELTRAKTAVFISHRLASTRFCDRILCMDKGKIVECGTHDELMALGGHYAQMFAMQAQYYN